MLIIPKKWVPVVLSEAVDMFQLPTKSNRESPNPKDIMGTLNDQEYVKLAFVDEVKVGEKLEVSTTVYVKQGIPCRMVKNKGNGSYFIRKSDLPE